MEESFPSNFFQGHRVPEGSRQQQPNQRRSLMRSVGMILSSLNSFIFTVTRSAYSAAERFCLVGKHVGIFEKQEDVVREDI